MSRSVTCYPQPGKAKSRLILEAFASGAGGLIDTTRELQPGPAAFFGVVGIEGLLHVKRAARDDWYYGDNAFFDCARGTHFRFGKNAFQQPYQWNAERDPARLKALGVEIRPWRRNGSHIVVVEQSDHFLSLVGQPGWWGRTVTEIRKHSDRPVISRRWNSNKQGAAAGLQRDLADAWLLVTHSSAAAVEAILAGVPVLTTDIDCPAAMFSTVPICIENPELREGREPWAAWLATMQWTLEELRSGMAWRTLNGA